MKSLADLTLAELWALFPIVLTEHSPQWADWFALERESLARSLPAGQIRRIGHIGSTAVPGIWAKPIVDILVEAAPGCTIARLKGPLERAGYLCMSEAARRISFNKGYTPGGFAERVFHLHLREAGDCDELYFRDYLIEHPDEAKAYERLKLSLWKPNEHNRDAYTAGKTEWVARATARARGLYAGRYD